MLVLGLLSLAAFPVIAGLGRVQQPTATARRIAAAPAMSPARKAAAADAAAAAAVSCTDIEEVPAGLVEGYRRHQAATYHAFTAEEVSRCPIQAAPRPEVGELSLFLFGRYQGRIPVILEEPPNSKFQTAVQHAWGVECRVCKTTRLIGTSTKPKPKYALCCLPFLGCLRKSCCVCPHAKHLYQHGTAGLH